MDDNKSLDKYKLIAALTSDVFTSLGSVLTNNTKALRLDLRKIHRRVCAEGDGFLTKTLPRLAKALDKALAEEIPLNSAELGFKPQPGSKLPILFGTLFNRILKTDGTPLDTPCVNSIKQIRQLLYLWYKYELPYSDEQEQHVITKFARTERELETVSERLCRLGTAVTEFITSHRRSPYTRFIPRTKEKEGYFVTLRERQEGPYDLREVTREARAILSDVLAFFDPKDIVPRHGPGAVATKQQLSEKYQWINVSAKITRKYPLDEFFFSSLGHVCDRVDTLARIGQEDLPARVCLVPKDSRGPRLISCEPVDYQWVQQGLAASLVRLIEHHDLTRYNVFFTDQVPNRVGALLGSNTGKYATLDLNEASDRVSLELVRLLFPPHIFEYLESCRSSSTVLPDGLILPLWKFAPMGSSLCFPIMALTIFSILAAAAPDADTRESIHVYGDDVIVPTAFAGDAIELLESFGLKINRDKSCIKGFFRESCGMDAYKGICVTPVRLRTVWSSSRSPDSYASWVAYANSFWDRRYYAAYDYIVGLLHSVYGAIPDEDMNLSCPSLRYVPDDARPKRSRSNPSLQKREWLVWDLKSPHVDQTIDGWQMLLRFFAEGMKPAVYDPYDRTTVVGLSNPHQCFSVSSYTRRSTSMLVKRWR